MKGNLRSDFIPGYELVSFWYVAMVDMNRGGIVTITEKEECQMDPLDAQVSTVQREHSTVGT